MLLTVLSVLLACDPGPCVATPAQASFDGVVARDRASLRDWLGAGDGIVVGQQGGAPPEAAAQWEQYTICLAERTGLWPGIAGFDLGDGWSPYPDRSEVRALALDHWSRGGLVTLNWSMPNPMTGDTLWDGSTRGRLGEVLEEGPAREVWLDMADGAGDFLADLQADGVVPLFRPFNEANGDWFWYGGEEGVTQAALWSDLRERVEARGADPLWVWSPNAVSGPEVLPVDHGFPGAELVDLVGISIYVPPEEAMDDLDAARALGLPVTVSEIGPGSGERDHHYDFGAAMELLAAEAPDARWALGWMGWGWPDGFCAPVENEDAEGWMAHPAARTLDELAWSE